MRTTRAWNASRSNRPGRRQGAGANGLAASLFLVALVVFAARASAQSGSRYTLGLSIGVVSASVTGMATSEGQSADASSDAGLLVRYRAWRDLNARVTLESGLGYARRGGTIEFRRVDPANRNLTTTHTGSSSLSYVELPLLARVQLLQPTRSLSLAAFAGPAVGLKISSKYDYTNVQVNTQTGETEVSSETRDPNDLSSLVISGIVGLEVGIRFEGVIASITSEFDQGLGGSVNSIVDVLDGVDLLDGKNRGLAFAASVMAPL